MTCFVLGSKAVNELKKRESSVLGSFDTVALEASHDGGGGGQPTKKSKLKCACKAWLWYKTCGKYREGHLLICEEFINSTLFFVEYKIVK